MKLELEGKNAIVTGGSSGIGLAVADGLLREGAAVVICARSDARLASARMELLDRNPNAKVLIVPADMSDPAGPHKVFEATESALGGVDLLFNNAGTGSEEKIWDAPDARWQYYWELHVMGMLRLSRLCAQSMKKRGAGAIVNNASICSVQPLDYEPIYNTSKAAMVMAGKCMANEFISHGIRVNTINPGLILTPDWIKTAKALSQGTGQTWQEYLDGLAEKHTPIKRFGTVDEVADFVLFLLSARASYCIGGSYFVDGGWLKVTH